jgi:hypothetical protein
VYVETTRRLLGRAGAVELAPDLWRWTAYHPEWKEDVGCLAYTDGSAIVLIDPMAPPEQAAARRFWKALDGAVRERVGPVHVVITVRWHERHAPEIVERYASSPGCELWAPAGAVPHLSRIPDHAFVANDGLPAGIVAFDTLRSDEVVLWLPTVKALATGDVLLGGKRKPLRVCPQSWLPRGIERAKLAASVRPLLELPVQLILPAHGAPIQADAYAVLERALADAA